MTKKKKSTPTTPIKDKRIVIRIEASYKVKMGHQLHMSGGGVHEDCRTKRLRTRGAKKRAAFKEWGYG